MKKYFSLVILSFISCIVFAQAGKKPVQKEKPPTQKEMQDMMKEMQKELNSMSPEDKKMMDSMGIKMPDMNAMQKNLSSVGDAPLKKAYEDDNRIVPKKDVARISKVLSVTLSNAEIAAYINQIQQAVLGKLSANVKSKGSAILQEIRAVKKSVASSAVGFWIEGKPTLALYLMGEAVKENSGNANDLNNYAAFLTMCGAGQMALPLLNNLNKRYPKNSSILNNIAQAWLSLGDIDRAGKYADSTIRIYANHPQANMAKCLIEESKGNIPAAIAAAKKSISRSFSVQKQNKLEKLGYKLKPADLNWDRPMPQDPMGLAGFKWPEYPSNVDESKILETEWEEFKNKCNEKLNKLQPLSAKLEREYISIANQRMKMLLAAGQNGQSVMPVPAYSFKGTVKLSYLLDAEGIPDLSFTFANDMQPLMLAEEQLNALEDKLETDEDVFNKKYEDQFGEGKSNPFEAACKEQNGIRNQFLNEANDLLQKKNKAYINVFRRKASNQLYYCQYTMWPEQFELAKVNAQVAWLTFISTQKVVFKNKSSYCVPKPNANGKQDSLQNFDDVACQYISTMNLGIYTITSKCSETIGHFDFSGVKIDIKDNVETNKMNATVVIGISKSIEGPAGCELEGSAAALLEIDNTGFTDVGLIVGADGKVGGQTVVGAEATITVNGGTSVSGKGILEGINY